MQHTYILRNFKFWFSKGAGKFHIPCVPIVSRLQHPFQVSQGFILAQKPMATCNNSKFPLIELIKSESPNCAW